VLGNSTTKNHLGKGVSLFPFQYLTHKYPFLAIHAKGGESIIPKQKDRTTTNFKNVVFQFVLKKFFNWYLIFDIMSHPVLEGKPNVNHVRARISNSRTQQLHNMDIITQCSNSIKKGNNSRLHHMSETST
jgi:hypothetical protein